MKTLILDSDFSNFQCHVMDKIEEQGIIAIKIEVIHDIHMDICENNLKALQRTYEIIQPYKEICIDGVAFLIKPNQKGIDTMREWFKEAIEIMENKLKEV